MEAEAGFHAAYLLAADGERKRRFLESRVLRVEGRSGSLLAGGEATATNTRKQHRKPVESRSGDRSTHELALDDPTDVAAVGGRGTPRVLLRQLLKGLPSCIFRRTRLTFLRKLELDACEERTHDEAAIGGERTLYRHGQLLGGLLLVRIEQDVLNLRKGEGSAR